MRGWYVRTSSLLDGAPLVTILTRGSDNPKTGRVVQSWILREDVEPRAALEDGRDSSICGGCVQRPFLGGRCYVRLHQGPQNIWAAYQRMLRFPKRKTYRPLRFPIFEPDCDLKAWAAGDPLRLGSYGDPAMVPAYLWRELIEHIGSPHTWTGFSHQWREPWAQEHRGLCMASVETAAEAHEAHALGWRTFRTMVDDGPALRNEFHCPASKKMGKRLDCRRCATCHGNPNGRNAAVAGSVVILEHGPRSRDYRKQLVQVERL